MPEINAVIVSKPLPFAGAVGVEAEQAPPVTRVRGYWRSVGFRLWHDPATLAFAAMVLLIVLAAVLAPVLAPFDPYKESIVGRQPGDPFRKERD